MNGANVVRQRLNPCNLCRSQRPLARAPKESLPAGLNLSRLARGKRGVVFPESTMLGALLRYVTSSVGGAFQPMKPKFGLLPALEPRVKGKRQRAGAYAERALKDLSGLTDLD